MFERFDQKGIFGVTGLYRITFAFTTFAKGGEGFDGELAFEISGVMASGAVGAKDRRDLLLVIDLGSSWNREH